MVNMFHEKYKEFVLHLASDWGNSRKYALIYLIGTNNIDKT